MFQVRYDEYENKVTCAVTGNELQPDDMTSVFIDPHMDVITGDPEVREAVALELRKLHALILPDGDAGEAFGHVKSADERRAAVITALLDALADGKVSSEERGALLSAMDAVDHADAECVLPDCPLFVDGACSCFKQGDEPTSEDCYREVAKHLTADGLCTPATAEDKAGLGEGVECVGEVKVAPAEAPAEAAPKAHKAAGAKKATQKAAGTTE